MGLEKETEIQGGRLTYEVRKDGICIKSCKVILSRVIIPPKIDTLPVTVIDKKAFLSCKNLREIRLPEGLVEIGDWAFAYCGKLESVALPYRQVEMGQGVFKECGRLVRIENRNDGEGSRDLPWLLAAAVNHLDAFYLFDLENVGTQSWLARWDARAKTLMSLEDSDGFSKMLLCGEEDYGSRENDLGYYMEQKRRGKVRLAMLRLMHDYGLGEAFARSLKEYLLSHIKGCETEETWRVVLEEHGDDKSYYEFLTELGGVTEENFTDLMEDMGQQHTEMKAYLMRYHDSLRGEKDAFSQFCL